MVVKSSSKRQDSHTKKHTWMRQFVFIAGLFFSSGMSVYFSLNGSYFEGNLGIVEITPHTLNLRHIKDEVASNIVVNNFYDVARKNPDKKPAPTVDETAARSIATAELNVSKRLSPYTKYRKNRQHAPKFAYAYVISGCNEDAAHRNYLYDISISTYVQREAGSTADVIVFIQMAFKSDLESLPEQDRLLMEAMDIQIRYIPKAEDESFYRTMLDKFLILGLTQYDRILFMDGDVMTRGSLDYLFDLSMKGILKKNIVTAGKTEPANGGFFMLAPREGAKDRVMAIISDKETRGSSLPYPHWDDVIGWGHVFGENDYLELVNGKRKDKWDFYGAFADQGLLYQWVKYEEKSVSIIFRHSIQNWDQHENGTVHLQQTLNREIFNEYSVSRTCWSKVQCHTPFIDFIHFTGKTKPWLRSPPGGFETDADSSASHFWYNNLFVLNNKMNLGIDFNEWRQFHRPYLGMYPTYVSAANTSYTTLIGQTNNATSASVLR